MKTLTRLLIAFLLSAPCYSQRVTLGSHLKKGQTYYQVQNLKTTIVETVNGREVNIIVSAYGKTSFQVKNMENENY
jgi:hypothetical protein